MVSATSIIRCGPSSAPRKAWDRLRSAGRPNPLAVPAVSAVATSTLLNMPGMGGM